VSHSTNILKHLCSWRLLNRVNRGWKPLPHHLPTLSGPGKFVTLPFSKEEQRGFRLRSNQRFRRPATALHPAPLNFTICETGGSNQIPGKLLCLPSCESAFPDVSISVLVALRRCSYRSYTGCWLCVEIRIRRALPDPISSKAQLVHRSQQSARSRYK